jgi:hypothetical protein
MAENEGRFNETQLNLYWLISLMKEQITIAVGTVLGGGIELPPEIIDEYARILRANIDFNKAVLPQQIFKLLSNIITFSQESGLDERRLERVKIVKHKFYAEYSLTHSKFTQNEGRAEKASLHHFNLGPSGLTYAEPVTNRTNGVHVYGNNMQLLPHAWARVVEPVVFDPTFGPLIKKKHKKTRNTKSANHKSQSKTPKRRSA